MEGLLGDRSTKSRGLGSVESNDGGTNFSQTVHLGESLGCSLGSHDWLCEIRLRDSIGTLSSK